MQRNTFSGEKQWISGPLDKRSTTLVELGTDGTVQNPKKHRTFALEISDEYDKAVFCKSMVFGETMVLLNRMESLTKEMSATARQVVALARVKSAQWGQLV